MTQYSDKDLQRASLSGMEISAGQADAMELLLAKNPEDALCRATLIGFYRSTEGQKAEKTVFKHLTWFIENMPDNGFSCSPLLFWPLNGLLSTQIYLLWHKQTELYPKNKAVTKNAVNFLLYCNPHFAEPILNRYLAESPNDLFLQQSLFRLLKTMSGRSAEALDLLEQILNLDPSFMEENKRILLAMELKEFKRAREYCLARLKHLSETNMCNEGLDEFSLSSVNLAHTVLGLIAMEQDDARLAKQHLASSLDFQNPKQFVPNLDLAKALARSGDCKTALDYLDKCDDLGLYGSKRRKYLRYKIEVNELEQEFDESSDCHITAEEVESNFVRENNRQYFSIKADSWKYLTVQKKCLNLTLRLNGELYFLRDNEKDLQTKSVFAKNTIDTEKLNDLLEELNLTTNDICHLDNSIKFQPYELWRQDDNGNQALIEVLPCRADANAKVKMYTERGHKQLYWCQPAYSGSAQ